jgi:hypothetical protein
MVSLLLVILVGVTAIAIDFGRMYLFRTQLHTSSDAAAMAGALRVLAGDATGAVDTSVAYGTSHQVDQSWAAMTHADVVPGTWDWQTSTFTPAPGLSWTSSAVNAVQATARYNAPFTFGRIFGYASRARQATSIAAVGSVGATDCVRPFAIPYAVLLEVLYPGAAPPVTYDLTVADVARLRTLTIANEILLKVGDSGQSPVPGNFYAVRLPPVQYANGESGDPWHGANSYRNAIGASCDQLPYVVGVGDWLQAEQGNMVGPTRDGVATLCGVAGGQSFRCSPPVAVKIAIWDVASRSIAPHYSFRVKYVGAFFVTGFSKDGVTGYFQSIASTGSFTPEPGPLSKVALVR